MKVMGSRPLVAPRSPAPFFFCCDLSPKGSDRFNFRAAVSGPKMQNSPVWGPPVRVLATTILLRSHPEWLRAVGNRASTVLSRRLAHEFACEYLLPNAGRAWIISSSTVREFAAETLCHSQSSAPLGYSPGICLCSNRLPAAPVWEVAYGST